MYLIWAELYGRGYSDAPGAIYDDAFYASQTITLLEHVGWLNGKFDLLGFSLGGAIATKFTTVYSRYLNNLILVAPAGLMKVSLFPLFVDGLSL